MILKLLNISKEEDVFNKEVLSLSNLRKIIREKSQEQALQETEEKYGNTNIYEKILPLIKKSKKKSFNFIFLLNENSKVVMDTDFFKDGFNVPVNLFSDISKDPKKWITNESRAFFTLKKLFEKIIIVHSVQKLIKNKYNKNIDTYSLSFLSIQEIFEKLISESLKHFKKFQDKEKNIILSKVISNCNPMLKEINFNGLTIGYANHLCNFKNLTNDLATNQNLEMFFNSYKNFFSSLTKSNSNIFYKNHNGDDSINKKDTLNLSVFCALIFNEVIEEVKKIIDQISIITFSEQKSKKLDHEILNLIKKDIERNIVEISLSNLLLITFLFSNGQV